MSALWDEGGIELELIELVFLGIGTYFDMKNKELPTAYLFLFGVVTIAGILLFSFENIGRSLIGAGVGGTFLFVGWMTKEAIGYGDGIGLVILGLLEGWPGIIPIVVGAFLLSGVYGIWRLLGCGDSRFEEIPFYPFLLIAFIGVMVL